MKIHGYSTALFSTWILIEDYGVLFDCGDGVVASLLHKSRKAKTIAISHADRDHVTGLLQINQLNAGTGIERILYPADSGSFPALRDFFGRFDPETKDAFPWMPVTPGQRIGIGASLQIEVVTNTHVASDLVKSVGYKIVQSKRKLKAEFVGLPSNEIEEIAKTRGREAISEATEEVLVAYAGDTGVEEADKWRGCQTLIHEATFIDSEDAESTRSRNLHSRLVDVLAMARDAGPERLILHHFSARYDHERIRSEIRRLAAEMKIGFPIYAILPGEVSRDVLNGPPLN